MKKLVFALLHKIGVIRFVAWWNRKRLMILCYHSVSLRPVVLPQERKPYVSADLFIYHLEYLKRHYHLISLDEYVRIRRAGEPWPDRSVVLTFDDGFRNFLTVAAPLLIERGIPATAFIITGETQEKEISAIERQWELDDDTSHLSWPEVQALAQESCIKFGSHTYSHPRLTQIPFEEAKRELKDSQRAIAEHLGYKSMALAFPYGETIEEISRLAASLGYDCALTGALGANDVSTDIYELRRTVIVDDDLSTFAARVSGLTWWFEIARARLRWVATKLFGQRAFRPQPSIMEQTDL